MSISIVRLGTPRAADEGPRIGTVRRPPRGVPKAEFASRDYYDTWLPLLAPSAELMAGGKTAESESDWARFAKRYRAEIEGGEGGRVLDMLALLSATSHFAVGCYCEDEARCHRSVLRKMLEERGAVLR
ncbi:DUF488 domain-containing protein [Metapseudomonas resinovorans]|uniref:DUF488 domain-containing protein n=1 Tax=Metapseudomonas resinovorans NBRC 106553 TaxID=1245471 RepID=S6AG92_METRE|nr:DUF488 family protein [Pseudomonas resinovorans]BAN46970.1 hypothetical protein PCA10_12380 [Pseudomonas resinovorans NBRC 106553]